MGYTLAFFYCYGSVILGGLIANDAQINGDTTTEFAGVAFAIGSFVVGQIVMCLIVRSEKTESNQRKRHNPKFWEQWRSNK